MEDKIMLSSKIEAVRTRLAGEIVDAVSGHGHDEPDFGAAIPKLFLLGLLGSGSAKPARTPTPPRRKPPFCWSCRRYHD